MRFRGVETKEVHELAMVLSIFVNTKIDVLAERLVKLGEVVFVFSDLTDKVPSLLHKSSSQ